MARIFWIWCRNGRMCMDMDMDTGLLEVWNSVRLQLSALYLHGFLVKNGYRNMRVTISTRTCELAAPATKLAIKPMVSVD